MMRPDGTKLLTGCLILTLFLIGTAAAADEIPPLPAQYHGTVITDGTPAPAGTVIIAKIGDTTIGTLILTEPGKLGGPGTFTEKLLAAPASSDAEGKEITFWINNIRADETTIFKAGAAAEITLTFSGVPVPSVTSTPAAIGTSDTGSSTELPSSTQGIVTPTGQTQTPATEEITDKQEPATTNPTVPTGTKPVGTVQTAGDTTSKETPAATQTRQIPTPLLGIFTGFIVALSLRTRTKT